MQLRFSFGKPSFREVVVKKLQQKTERFAKPQKPIC